MARAGLGWGLGLLQRLQLNAAFLRHATKDTSKLRRAVIAIHPASQLAGGYGKPFDFDFIGLRNAGLSICVELGNQFGGFLIQAGCLDPPVTGEPWRGCSVEGRGKRGEDNKDTFHGGTASGFS